MGDGAWGLGWGRRAGGGRKWSRNVAGRDFPRADPRLPWLAGEGLGENLLRADTFSCDLFLQSIFLHAKTYGRQMCMFCLDI